MIQGRFTLVRIYINVALKYCELLRFLLVQKCPQVIDESATHVRSWHQGWLFAKMGGYPLPTRFLRLWYIQ